jgi:hypothetical protein
MAAQASTQRASPAPVRLETRRRVPRLVVAGLAILAVLAVVTTFIAMPRVQVNSSLERGRQADAERYTALAEDYAANVVGAGERAIRAEAARLQGLADVYASRLAGRQRAAAAYAARLTALAEHYAAQGE